MFETLNTKTAVKEGTIKEHMTQNLLKVQRSLKPEHMSHIKKILIFLHEKMCLFQQVDPQYTIRQCSQFMARLFTTLPKPQ